MIFIDGMKAPNRFLEKFRCQVRSPNAAYAKASAKVSTILRRIEQGDDIHPADIGDVADIARAVQSIRGDSPVARANLIDLVRESLEIASVDPRHVANSYVRRAIARLDELFGASTNAVPAGT